MASAKLAKRTVNQSQRVICSSNEKKPMWCVAFQTSWNVVRTAPTSTTNMTGFLAISRGSSLRKESAMARERIALSARDFFRICVTGSIFDASEDFAGLQEQVLENRAETQSGKEGESAYDENRGDEQAAEESAGDGERADRFGDGLLFCEAAGDGDDGNDHEEAAEELSCGRGGVVPGCVGGETAEGGTVIAGGGDVGVENLR